MMCEEVYLLKMPFRSKHCGAFWHFLSFYVILYIDFKLLIRLESLLRFVILL